MKCPNAGTNEHECIVVECMQSLNQGFGILITRVTIAQLVFQFSVSESFEDDLVLENTCNPLFKAIYSQRSRIE